MTRKLIIIGTIMSLILVAISLSCTSSPATSPSDSTEGVSLENDVQPIFSQNCVTCHQGGSPQGGLSLEPAEAYEELVNVPSMQSDLTLVEPEEPDNSYLIDKLNGTHLEAGGNGAQMPFGQSPLSQSQIDLISQWISEGAADN